MAELKITIPDDKVQLVLDAFANQRGIDATAQAVKKEFTDEIKLVVRTYKCYQLEQGQVQLISQSDIEVGVE